MLAERVINEILKTEKRHPEREFFFTRGLEASHILLRLGKKTSGCLPIAIAFTHGAHSLSQEHYPLSMRRFPTMVDAALKMADKNHQSLSIMKTDGLASTEDLALIENPDILEKIAAAWVISLDRPPESHVVGVLRVPDVPDCFAVYDPASSLLADPDLETFGFYGFRDVLRRAMLHHHDPDASIIIIGFTDTLTSPTV